MNENIENNLLHDSSAGHDIDQLREHLAEGGFGGETIVDEDLVPDEAVVGDFLSQFGAAGDTPLKAHDWKAYVPSSMCNSSFWGPLFGIIREETESIYVFDSKEYEKDEYVIGYIDNGSFSSKRLMNSFSRNTLRLIGVYSNGEIHLRLTKTNQNHEFSWNNDSTAAAIKAIRKRVLDGWEARWEAPVNPDYTFHPVDSTYTPVDPTSPPSHANGTIFKPVDKAVLAASGDRVVENVSFSNCQENESFYVRVKLYDTVTNLFSRNTGLLESSIMLDKRAVLVGCGSVGSFVAMELARSGVGKFVLCDTDTLEIHNICRHQCGYDDLGRYKVDAVKDKILNINPNAEVITYRSTIQRIPEDELLPLLGRDTIIIGGGDNRASADWSCKLAIRTDSTFVATCCWTRAFAGEIFYWTSGRNLSCYTCALGGLIDEERPESHATYFGSDEEKDKLSFEPGVAVDIDFVTIIAVKLALDLLNRDNPDYTPRVIDSLRQYTWICNTNSTRIGGERAGIFSYPLQITRNLSVHKDDNCPFCGGK